MIKYQTFMFIQLGGEIRKLVLQIYYFIFTVGGLQGAQVAQGINQTGLPGLTLLGGQQLGTGLC